MEELESRNKKHPNSSFAIGMKHIARRDLGYGKDWRWREEENDQGYTHFEELLIYQPSDWRKQAREYLYRFSFNLERISQDTKKRVVQMQLPTKDGEDTASIVLETPIMAVLFHPEIDRSCRYEPLNFLLSYGAADPFPNLMTQLEEILTEEGKSIFREELSPLDYFFVFKKHVQSYKLEALRQVGRRSGYPRLWLLKELDYSNIIGQRLAKQMIRSSVFCHAWNQSTKEELCCNRKPLSMIFAGPSGTGKTELALCLGTLLNKPSADPERYFKKVDCGQITDDKELFGMSGAFFGSEEGSALNNFVLRMSREPEARGIVLLDEIEKAERGVIHGLYQVLDKGEWTNKKLERGKAHTETVSCQNIIFIMTTNAADRLILETISNSRPAGMYYTVEGPEEIEDLLSDLESSVRKKLQHTRPFTDAFIGRVGRIVPFLPLANGDPDSHPLLGESMTITKLLIEREQEKLALADGGIGIQQLVSAKTKHTMAKIIVRDAIVESGVRGLQDGVEKRMANRMMEAFAREKQSIKLGAHVRYLASEEDKKIDFRVEKFGSRDTRETEAEDWENTDDMFG
jgi:DNA polymerase III delta prime subunit